MSRFSHKKKFLLVSLNAKMPYRRRGGRRNYRRRSRRTSRSSRLRYIKRRKGAHSQSRQIASLERRVNQLDKESTQYAQFSTVPENAAGATGLPLPDGDFNVSCLIKPAGWNPIFQSWVITGENAAFTPNKMKITSCDLQFVFSPKNSTTALTPRIVRVWLLKLKKETAMETLQASNQMTSAGFNALDDKYVYKTTTGGGLDTMVKFNPAAFDVKQYREFTVANIIQETADDLGDTDVGVTNTADALKRVRMFHTMGNEFKVPQGGVRAMTEADVMPLDRWYVVTHVGGFGADGDNQVRMDTNWFLNSKMYV